MKTSAQNKEDLVLVQYFQGNRGGVFVDVGAHDGIQFSNTHLLEADYGWTGICVEPNPDSFRKLVKNRPNSKCFEIASVNHARGKTQLLVPNGVGVLGSTKPERRGIGRILNIQPNQVKYQKYSVHSESLGVTITRAGFAPGQKYDLLSVDTEWTELDVLRSACLEEYTPAVIVVEANDSDFAKAIQNYLEGVRYHLCGFVGGINYFYVNDRSNVNKMAEAIAYVVSGGSTNV